jgi:metal-responsive CopG/Arc/MetJ family transcriptional regulator
MDLTPSRKTKISASVPRDLVKQLDSLTHKAQWVHDTKISRSELISYLCSEQLDANDSEDIVNAIEEDRKDKETVTATK